MLRLREKLSAKGADEEKKEGEKQKVEKMGPRKKNPPPGKSAGVEILKLTSKKGPHKAPSQQETSDGTLFQGGQISGSIHSDLERIHIKDTGNDTCVITL